MSDTEAAAGAVGIEPEEADGVEPGYKPPAEKSLNEIINQDQDDDALARYKAALLGDAASGEGPVLVYPDDPRQVIVQKLALVVDDMDDKELDLTQDLNEIKKQKFVIKEGIKFRIRIDFIVQREIVTGLKYIQKTTRKGVTMDKMTHMVGSYAPKATSQSYTTPYEDAPSGILGRGTYTVNSFFTDDDKHDHLKWEWTIEFKKDWEWSQLGGGGAVMASNVSKKHRRDKNAKKQHHFSKEQTKTLTQCYAYSSFLWACLTYS